MRTKNLSYLVASKRVNQLSNRVTILVFLRLNLITLALFKGLWLLNLMFGLLVFFRLFLSIKIYLCKSIFFKKYLKFVRKSVQIFIIFEFFNCLGIKIEILDIEDIFLVLRFETILEKKTISLNVFNVLLFFTVCVAFFKT